MRIRNRSSRFGSGPSRQKGVIATLIAVIVLVATLLAAIALMRSVDTSNTIAGSLSFRQGALQEAELAYQDAKTQGATQAVFVPPGGDTDHPAVGYYSSIQSHATRQDLPDLLTTPTDPVNYPGTAALTGAALAASVNKVHYIVERICPLPGPATPAICIVPGTAISGGSSSNSSSDPGIPFNTTGSAAAFRITVRVDGPKGTVAYVQTIMR
jgi:type IV pilus assembly protein PilX